MLSNYFSKKTKTEEFKNYVNSVIEEAKDKKILIYGAGSAFVELNNQYHFTEILNVVAIADKKFIKGKDKIFCGKRAISPDNINSEDFDIILLTNEYYEPIENFLKNNLHIKNENIKTILKQDIQDERKNLNYLYKKQFDKTLPKLVNSLKNKKVVLYGAGAFFRVIQKYYDLSDLNIIAIADKKFENHKTDETLNIKTCAPENIIHIKPDIILISLKEYVDVLDYIYVKLLRSTDIKAIPMVKKSFWEILKICFA